MPLRRLWQAKQSRPEGWSVANQDVAAWECQRKKEHHEVLGRRVALPAHGGEETTPGNGGIYINSKHAKAVKEEAVDGLQTWTRELQGVRQARSE